MTGPSSEQRAVNRVPVSVSVGTESGELGETLDLSLGGAFVATDAALEAGSTLPIIVQLEDDTQLQMRAQVVRNEGRGVGLRFVDPDPRSARRLRRYITEKTSLETTRDTARRLLAISDREPLRDPAAIRSSLLDARAGKATFRITSTERSCSEDSRLEHIDDDSLLLRAREDARLEPGEDVLVLYTQDYVKWSFGGVVLSVEGKAVRLSLPRLLAYQERRGSARAGSSGRRLLVPLPWDPKQREAWEIVETGPGGLSVRASTEHCPFRPGAELTGVTLLHRDGEEELTGAVVRHITPVEEGDTTWLRVGISHGEERVAPKRATAELKPPKPSGVFQRLTSGIKTLTTGVSTLWTKSRTSTEEGSTPYQVVRLKNGEKTVVGLLDRAFPDEAERASCPLVVVVPGFGGRKEQFSFLANPLTWTFRRNHQDVAVLRVDGTNNLGESWKDPAARGAEGRATLRFRVEDTIEDLRACMAWARNNPYVDPTTIVLVASSFGAVPARHFLASGEGSEVSHFVSWFGAADARNSIQHVSGHLDIIDNWERGVTQGVNSLGGCLVDVDHFMEDLIAKQIGRLSDARREMGRIHADVTWIHGRFDAFMDPRRVRDVMEVAAPGERELIEVDSGHVPTSGEEARAQAHLATRVIYRRIHGTAPPEEPPALGRLQGLAAAEWSRVRRDPLPDRAAYWREYLLADDSPGFDVLTWSSAYNEFMDQQAELLLPRGQRVLDLGCGTGNLSVAVARRRPERLVCGDLVPEALDRARGKVEAVGGDAECTSLDLEGSPRLAMRRFVSGELGDVRALARRVPGLPKEVVNRLVEADHPDLHALLRGHELDPRAVVHASKLRDGDVDFLRDLNLVARRARGLVGPAAKLRRLPPTALQGDDGLPWASGSFDAVGMSLVLSYLDHPDDVLSEALRVLAPGGRIVVSSMRRDADSSRLFHDLLRWFQEAPEAQLEGPWTREQLAEATRRFVDQAAGLLRLEEEGVFRFYDADELEATLRRAGFEQVQSAAGFGEPAQAVIAWGRRP